MAVNNWKVLLPWRGRAHTQMLHNILQCMDRPQQPGVSDPKCPWCRGPGTGPGQPPTALLDLTCPRFCEFGPELSSPPAKVSNALMTSQYDYGSLNYKEEEINQQQGQRQGTLPSAGQEALQ